MELRDETYGEWRRRELRRIAGEVAAIEATIDGFWLTRWAYRLIKVVNWRPWR